MDTQEIVRGQEAAQQNNDIATSWVKVAHWIYDKGGTSVSHLLVNGRSVVRDYVVNNSGEVVTIDETPAEYSRVGEVVSTDSLKLHGYARVRNLMFNTVSLETAVLR